MTKEVADTVCVVATFKLS